MLATVKRPYRWLIPVVGPLIFLPILFVRYPNIRLSHLGSNGPFFREGLSPTTYLNGNGTGGGHKGTQVFTLSELVLAGTEADGLPIFEMAEQEHREIFSVSTADGKYFPIRFAHQVGINPNIIPHPRFNDTWIIVAQQQASNIKGSVWFAELVCNAVFENDTLSCDEPPQILPIAATYGDSSNCHPDLDFLTVNIGPHDARVFYGPQNPYTVYGSNSQYTCFGQWVLDFRLLVDWGYELADRQQFREATELQRPPPYGKVEKNFFLFWDTSGDVYAHYDMYPKRNFAKLAYDGSVGEDLASLAAANDDKCMVEYMPLVREKLESIHQATNSLSITLCERSNPACVATDANTFILTIFHHKSYYYMHSVYEPYAILFEQISPFKIHGISSKPLWISGRGKPGQWTNPSGIYRDESSLKNGTEMFYVTSMSWKTKGQKYHGYLDDVVFLAFGIEDSTTGGIDVLAGDLLEDLALCKDLH